MSNLFGEAEKRDMLHRLPVQERIKFKILLQRQASLVGTAPKYIDLLLSATVLSGNVPVPSQSTIALCIAFLCIQVIVTIYDEFVGTGR